MAIKWSSWASLGKPPETEIGRPCAQRNQDGRLEVFALGQGEIFNISQVSSNGAWRKDWRSKGRPSSQVGLTSHVVGRNADGRLEIFGVGDDSALWQKWQVAPNNGWVDEWKSLGSPFQRDAIPRVLEQFVVGRNQDGRQEIFALWSFNGVFPEAFQIWQTAPNGGCWQIDQAPFWSAWESLGAPPPKIREADRLTVGTHQDGRLEVFLAGEDGAVWHTSQIR